MAHVYVEIDLDEFSKTELLDELKKRGIVLERTFFPCPIAATDAKAPWEEFAGWCQELRAAFHSHDAAHFEITLLRMTPVKSDDLAKRAARFKRAA